MPKPPLSSAQESRLIRYLDQQLLALSGAFERRHSGASGGLASLAAFLDALHPLLAFILSIPAAPPSHSLRVAYLLQLTGFLAPALDGYTLSDDALPQLWSALDRFDTGWVAVLSGQDWDSARGEPAPASDEADQAGAQGGAAMRTTDRVRLDSLVREVKGVLAISLGLPEFVPLENDPFEQVLRQRELAARTRSQTGAPARPTDDEEGDRDDEMRPASGAETPSLVSDGETAEGETDDAMSVDTAVATPSEVIEVSSSDDDAAGLDEDDEDGVDFEEVALPASASASGSALMTSSSTAASSTSDLPSAYATPPAADGSFSLHFTGLPPPTLQDGELSLQDGATPFVAQRRGFDPDAEYPLSEEEGDPIVDEGEGEEEGEDGIDEGTKAKVERVFERTVRLLAELRAQAEAAA